MRVLIDKETLLEKIRAMGDPLNAGKMWMLILKAPEIKRTEQIRCKDCQYNKTELCHVDESTKLFKNDDVFYCYDATRKTQ